MSRTHIYREMSALEIVDPMLETVVIRGGHIDREAFHEVASYFMKPPAPSGSCRDRETRAIYTMRAGRTNREEVLSSGENAASARTLRNAIEGRERYIFTFRGTAMHRHVIGMLTPTDHVCNYDIIHMQVATTAYSKSRINAGHKILSVTSLLDLLRHSYNRQLGGIPDLFLFPEQNNIIENLADAHVSSRTPGDILRDLARREIPDEAYVEGAMCMTYTSGGVGIHPNSPARRR